MKRCTLERLPILVWLLLAINLFLHLIIISRVNFYIFDEVWYVPAAKTILFGGSDLRPEHPPLAQEIIAFGILLFGDNPFGWRFFNSIFGALSVLVLYLLSNSLTKDQTLSICCSALFSFEWLSFTFSSLALLDIFAVFFMLLGSYLFVEKCPIRSGVAIALGALSKLTAILIIPAIAFYAILLGATTSRAKSSARALSIKLTLWIIAMIITFFPLLFLLDRIYEASQIITYEKLANPFEHVSWMVDIHTSRNWPIRTEIPPWLWLVKLPNYYLGSESLAQINFLEALNPAIMGLALVSFPYTLIALLKSRTRIAVFSSLCLITTYLSWIPVYFLFSRPLFPFYLIAAIPSICMLNCFFFREVPKALIFYTACSITFFLLFQYPWRLLF